MAANPDSDLTGELQEQVKSAGARSKPLRIVGGDSKAFLGRAIDGHPLAVAGHRGILSYEPTELVLTARAGTPLHDIYQVLEDKQQMLAFDPPAFSPNATLGGTIACGLSGPMRPYLGAARDFVLGTRVLNGAGKVLRFGGEVMKNVAGYDASRLMVGAMGTLGVLLDISLKVLPKHAADATCVLEMGEAEAIRKMAEYGRSPVPLVAASHFEGQLYLRFAGAESAVRAACEKTGGKQRDATDILWKDLREHRHAFFTDAEQLLRISVPAATPPLMLPGSQWIDWGGAQRWLGTESSLEEIQASANAVGGHARLFRGGDPLAERNAPLAPAVAALHQNLKRAFDPYRVLNIGRLYRDL